VARTRSKVKKFNFYVASFVRTSCSAQASGRHTDSTPLPLNAVPHNNTIESLRQELLGKIDAQANDIRTLQSSNAELVSKVKWLTSSNIELKSSNAELKSFNAELKSSNAELKSSNAELISKVNGLTSSNAELSEKVNKLVESHTEMSSTLQKVS